MNILQFAQKVEGKDIDYKTEALNNINGWIESGVNPDGSKIEPKHLKAIKVLSRWLTMNLFIGDELCPAEHILTMK